MRHGVNRVKASQKAAHLRRMGYATSVHALTPEAKNDIDRYLTCGTSIRDTLKVVCSKYPNERLPSVGAVHNYKKKYLNHGFFDKDLRKPTISREIEKKTAMTEISRSLLELHYTLVINILPKLMEGLEKGLIIENNTGIPLEMNNKRLLAITRLLSEVNKFIGGHKSDLISTERKIHEFTSNPQEEINVELEYEKIFEFLNIAPNSNVINAQTSTS